MKKLTELEKSLLHSDAVLDGYQVILKEIFDNDDEFFLEVCTKIKEGIVNDDVPNVYDSEEMKLLNKLAHYGAGMFLKLYLKRK